MALFQYNGVQLPLPLITDFQQIGMFEESGTDRYVTKFDISCQSIINTQYVSQLFQSNPTNAQGFSTTDPATMMRFLRNLLLQSRKKLIVSFNGVNLVPQDQRGNLGTTDAQNGPIPMYCNIYQLNNVTFLINYRIMAHYWENNNIQLPTSNGVPIFNYANATFRNEPGNTVLYNRWAEDINIDKCNYSVRTREGKFMIRSDNAKGLTADEVRTQFAVVSVPEGCVRQSSEYAIAPNGLSIRYKIVDREVFKMPPILSDSDGLTIAQAYEASGLYSLNSGKGDASQVHKAMVRLKGAKNQDQAGLVRLAMGIVTSKLNSVGVRAFPTAGSGKKTPNSIMLAATLNINMFENEVEFSMEVMVASPLVNHKGIAIPLDHLTFTPGSDVATPQPPPVTDRGTLNYLLLAAAYYDPSLTNYELSTDPVTIANEGKNNQRRVGNVAVQNRAGNFPGTDVGRGGVKP